MEALVIYESMYGNTRRVAEAIADGLGGAVAASVFPVGDVEEGRIIGCDLVVVGGPTHVHGMSRPSTRRRAADVGSATGVLDVSTQINVGVREWLAATHAAVPGQNAVAFDTRNHGLEIITGSAARGISEGLRKAGFQLLADGESFEVGPGPAVDQEEIDRASRWGAELAQLLVEQQTGENDE